MLKQLLTLMSDGRFHSGDELGEIMGVSRAAVWKQLKKLEDMDIPYSSVKGKGYRLHDPVELLDENRIIGSLSQRLDQLDILLTVDSTNSWMLEQASEHMGKRCAVLAEMQTGGRGRRGRHWVSPFGKNIYLSLLVTLPGQLTDHNGLSLIVAIAVEKALVKLGLREVGLKWPNDVYLHGRKLAGILLEARQSQAQFCQVVIGVGINVALSEQDAAEINQPWAAIRQFLPEVSRNELAAVLIEQLLILLDAFQRDGFSPWMGYWSDRDVFYRREVRVTGTGEDKTGIVKGVNRNGELLLHTEKGMEVLFAGELSVRAAD